MKTIILIVTYSVFFSLESICQTNKSKYKVVAKLSDGKVLKGIFDEVKDSLVIIELYCINKSDSLNLPSMAEISYKDIDKLKFQKENRKTGSFLVLPISGLGMGLVHSAITGFAPVYSLVLSSLTTTESMSLSFLESVVKDHIPIKRSYYNFDKYRKTLDHYALNGNISTDLPFKHKSQVGISYGFSIPLTPFVESQNNFTHQKKIKSGFVRKVEISHYFTKNFGVYFSSGLGIYPFRDKITISSNFFTLFNINVLRLAVVRSYNAGPVVTFSGSDRLKFNLTPIGGICEFKIDSDEPKFYSDISVNYGFNGSVSYDYSKRWKIFTSVGYLHSDLNLTGKVSAKVNTIDLGFGISYKFSKNGL